eukprot:SAG11_NODE_2075_length_3857_cov_64.192656_3_plen_177_part_00
MPKKATTSRRMKPTVCNKHSPAPLSLKEAQAVYAYTIGDLPNKYKNNRGWICQKIAEKQSDGSLQFNSNINIDLTLTNVDDQVEDLVDEGGDEHEEEQVTEGRIKALKALSNEVPNFLLADVAGEVRLRDDIEKLKRQLGKKGQMVTNYKKVRNFIFAAFYPCLLNLSFFTENAHR